MSCVSHLLCLTWLLYNSVAIPRRQSWDGGENLGVVILSWYVMPYCQRTWRMSAERKKRGLRIGPAALQLAKSRR